MVYESKHSPSLSDPGPTQGQGLKQLKLLYKQKFGFIHLLYKQSVGWNFGDTRHGTSL